MFSSNLWTKCLICLICITCGNSECPKPQMEVTRNVVLSNDALLMNDFPEGSEATFECANGYIKDQGSESITCANGEWSTLELTCKKKDCGAPKEMPHLTYEFGEEGTLFGASARAFCDKGYQVQGSSYRQCYATGWSGRSRCEAVTCEEPFEIINGTISAKPDKESPEYGDVIQYSCDEGYTLIGNKSIECNEDGEYNSIPPECKDVNDIPLEPTTTISTTSASKTTTLTVPPIIRDVNDIPLEPTTTISTTSASKTTTLTVPPIIRDVNDIPLEPTTTISTTSASKTTTLTVPPIIRVSGRNHDIGEHHTNTATRNAAVVGSVIGIFIVTLIVLFIFCRFHKRKGARTPPIC